jgi:tetratricopeptide (TPR) repeat protein
MRIFLQTLALAAGLLAGPFLRAAEAPPRAETLAEKTLKDIVARQRDILARADQEGDQLDLARMRGELQNVIHSYDVLIQKSPDFAPAYVAYGLLLGRVGMTREAVGILLKANKLDADIPIVKNEMARFLAEDGKVVEALPWLTAAIGLEPKEPLYHYHLGKLLAEGRDDFIKTGQFTRPALDQAMLEAFARAAELAPADIGYAYRSAEAYYDLETPQWDAALAAWTALETRVQPGVEQQTIRLQAANVLLKMGRRDHARAMLITVTEPVLAKQKQTLLDSLATAGAK